jgi:glycosyltransferase involved in cell wall biosynthesis
LNRITILTITYNSANFINRCYKSIINQYHTNWIWLVVDDGSTDDTKSIIENLHSDKIEYHKLPFNQGRGFARNYAINKLSTDFCVLLDIDDLMLSNRLHYFNIAINENYIGMVSSVLLINDYNIITGQRGLVYNKSKYFTHATLCIKSEILKNIKYSEYRYAEDQKILYYISKLNGIKKINEPLYIYQEDATISCKNAFYSNYYAFLTYIKISFIEKFDINIYMTIFNLFFKTIILFFLSLFKNRDKVYKKLIKHRVKENKILISKEDKFYLKNIFNIHFLE